MKRPQAIRLLVIIITFFACSLTYAINTISLKTACDKKLIKLKINGTSSNYGDCMDMNITNLTNSPISVKLETGRKLICVNDTTRQNMMITKELIVNLKSKENKTYKSFAMCIQKTRSTPNKEASFKIGNLSDGYLLLIAKFIEKYNYQDNIAQKAVWAVIEKSDSNNLYSYTSNTQETEAFKRFVTFAKAGKPIWFDALFSNQEYNSINTKPEYYISGVISWEMPETGVATMKVYDETGNYITDVFVNKEYKEGIRYCDFKVVNCLIKPNQKYFVKLIIKEKTLKELACLSK